MRCAQKDVQNGDRDEDIPSRGNMLSGKFVADLGIRVEGVVGAAEPVPGADDGQLVLRLKGSGGREGWGLE